MRFVKTYIVAFVFRGLVNQNIMLMNLFGFNYKARLSAYMGVLTGGILLMEMEGDIDGLYDRVKTK